MITSLLMLTVTMKIKLNHFGLLQFVPCIKLASNSFIVYTCMVDLCKSLQKFFSGGITCLIHHYTLINGLLLLKLFVWDQDTSISMDFVTTMCEYFKAI